MKPRLSPKEQWEFHARQSGICKQRAMDRLLMLDQIDKLVGAGVTKSSAVNLIASTGAASAASIWNWLRTVEGVSRHDWLAYLTPAFRGGGRLADLDHAMFAAIAEDYLHPARRSWAECFRRLQDLAKERGVDLPHSRTLRRRLEREYGSLLMDRLRGEDQPAWLRARLPVNDR